MPEAALLLSPEAPYPLAGGGQLRTASVLHYLAQRHSVDLIVFREPSAPDPRDALPPGLVREAFVIDLPHHRRTPLARAARNLSRLLRGAPPLLDRFSGAAAEIAAFLRGRRYRLAVVEHFWCTPYWREVAPAAAFVGLDLHNVESVLHARYAAAERPPASLLHAAFARRCRRLEREWLPRYDVVLAPSETDAARARLAGARAAVYPNAIPWRPLPAEPRAHAIGFSGNFGYQPNIAAVRYFAGAIWPLLRRKWPHLEWRLIGRNPEYITGALPRDGRIRVTGPVEDAVLALAQTQAAVVPLLAGSGTRFKIIEAWAAGVPVVSTTIGAEGLPQQHILIADAPHAFADAVSRLLSDGALAARFSAAGRATYEERFTWQAAWAGLHTALTRAGTPAPGG